MSKQLGPTFGNEVIAAGVGGLPFCWGETDDSITGRENLTTEQNATLDGVIEAHDPSKQLPPDPAAEDVVLYDHENRLRAIEGVPPLDLGEFVQKKSRRP